MAACTDQEPAGPDPEPVSADSELPDFHGPGDGPTTGTTAAEPLRWGVGERRRVVDHAVDVMRLFARPDLPDQRWWAALEPHLSAQAQHDYVGVDPSRVPVSAVEGPGVLVPMDTDRLAVVHVPTDAGLYAVTLSRSPAAPEWVVERITPPEADPHAPGEQVED